MRLHRLHYSVSVEVEFPPEEVAHLIFRAATHYSATVREAARAIHDGAKENGFIAQLKMFPGATRWDSWKVDIALKAVEINKYDELGKKIFWDLRRAWNLLSAATQEADINGNKGRG